MVAAREAAVPVASVVAADAAAPGESHAELASKIGEAWADEYVRDLQTRERAPVGGWPGTMSEARSRVLRRLAIVLTPERLDELARIANLAAKRGWQLVCKPDPDA